MESCQNEKKLIAQLNPRDLIQENYLQNFLKNLRKTYQNTNKVDYVFRDAEVGDRRLHDVRYVTYWSDISNQKKMRDQETNTQVLKQLKIMNIKGPLILFIIFKEIKVQEFKFVYELMKGNETMVPRKMLMKDLPSTLGYYNPLIRIINKTMDRHTKTNINL